MSPKSNLNNPGSPIALAALKHLFVPLSRPDRCFGHLDDTSWLWANTEGPRRYTKQYGSACIPEAYVRDHWAPDFRLRVYSDHEQTGFGQNLIVATRQ